MPEKSNVEMEGVLERAVKLHEEENSDGQRNR